MPWIGDVHVPLLTDKDTSIDKQVIEKNFVESPPQVYELTANIEAGTYTAVLVSSVHQRGESIEEQADGVRSLVDRHPIECAYVDDSDVGYLVVENSNVSHSSEPNRRGVSVDLRFMEDGIYKPAFQLNTDNIFENYTLQEDFSLFPVPSNLSNILFDGYSLNPEFVMDTRDGQMEFYLYDQGIFEYDNPTGDSFTEPIRFSPVRTYDSNSTVPGKDADGNYQKPGSVSQNRRIYSESKPAEGNAILENGTIQTFITDDSYLYAYESGSWESFGVANVGFSNYIYSTDVSIYNSSLALDSNYELTVYRGFPMTRFDVETTSFEFHLFDPDVISSETEEYVLLNDAQGRDIFFLRTSYNGSMTTAADQITVDNISEETFFAGIVPSNVSDPDLFMDHILNMGSRKPTLIQR